MKKHCSLLLLLITVTVCGGAAEVRADDLFRIFWRGTYYTRNSSRHILAGRFSEQDLVNSVAQSTGEDPNQLVLVYRPQERDVAVVRNNGAFVASVFQMQSTYTDIDNPSGSVTVRHALITDESHSDPLGSFFGYEARTLGPQGGLINDSLVGMATYSKSDSGLVYSARVRTGSRLLDTTNS